MTLAEHSDRKASTRRIIAVDGEGKNIPLTPGVTALNPRSQRDGWHSYNMLVAADDQGWRDYIIHDGTRREASEGYARNYGLRTKECLDFLLSLPRDAIVVGFYFSYDVVKILADVPEKTLRELSNAKMGDWVEWEGYALQYTPRKQFTVARVSDGKAYRVRKRGSKTVREGDGWATQTKVYDVFGFFQSSFVVALQKASHLFDEAVIKRIADMKEQRADFDTLPESDVLAYCTQECEYLSVLVRDLLGHCEKLNLKLTRFDGAGALAEAWFKREKVKEFKTPTNLPHDVALYAYFGGRFEISEIGYIGTVHSYDINSAYPNIAATLPCLVHGEFEHVSEYVPDKIGVYRVGSLTEGNYAPFAFRASDDYAKSSGVPKKSIFYAHGGQRWAWQDEVKIARKHFGADAIPVYEGWVWNGTCNHKPFGQIPEMFEYRKELKRKKDGAEKVVKLLINSIYGKTAQSIGGRIDPTTGEYIPPAFQSFIWAGLITSGTRAMILDAVMMSGQNVSIATDGIMSRTPIDTLSVGGNLGDWEYGQVEDVYLFQSGVYTYWYMKDGKRKDEYKTRGFSRKEVPAEKLIEAWNNGHTDVEDSCTNCRENKPCGINVPPEDESRFIPIKMGVTRNHSMEFIGQWSDSEHEVTFAHTRRSPVMRFDEFGLPDYSRDVTVESEPFRVPNDVLSAIYEPKDPLARNQEGSDADDGDGDFQEVQWGNHLEFVSACPLCKPDKPCRLARGEAREAERAAAATERASGPKRLLITGSREYDNVEAMRAALIEAGKTLGRNTVLVHGAARGADRLAGRIWAAWGLPVEEHPADWTMYGKAAGFRRNSEMVRAGADLALAFPIGDSRGTRDAMRQITAAGIPLRVYEGEPE